MEFDEGKNDGEISTVVVLECHVVISFGEMKVLSRKDVVRKRVCLFERLHRRS